MNKEIFKMFARFTLLIAIAFVTTISFTSCDDDDDMKNPEPDPIPKFVPGVYIFGENTVSTDLVSEKGKMELATLVEGETESLYGGFYYMNDNAKFYIAVVNSDSISIDTLGVSGELETVASTVFSEDTTQIKSASVLKATLVKSGSSIDVSSKGLYYVALDITKKSFAGFKVEAISPYGSAVPKDTALVQTSITDAVALYSLESFGVFGGEYSFMFNNGYFFQFDENASISFTLGVDEGKTNDQGKVAKIGGEMFVSDSNTTSALNLVYNQETKSWTENLEYKGPYLGEVDRSKIYFEVFGTALTESDTNTVVDESVTGGLKSGIRPNGFDFYGAPIYTEAILQAKQGTEEAPVSIKIRTQNGLAMGGLPYMELGFSDIPWFYVDADLVKEGENNEIIILTPDVIEVSVGYGDSDFDGDQEFFLGVQKYSGN
jgi:hypothetical protein